MDAIDLEVIYQATLQIARELTLDILRTGLREPANVFRYSVVEAYVWMNVEKLVFIGDPPTIHCHRSGRNDSLRACTSGHLGREFAERDFNSALDSVESR